MTIVDAYVARVVEMRATLANLAEWVDTLPAPDDDNDIRLTEGHLDAIRNMHSAIRRAAIEVDVYHKND